MSRLRIFGSILSYIAFLLMIAAVVSLATIATSAAPQLNAPSNINAVAVSDSRIDVSWQDNSPNETGFEAHRSTNGPNGAFTLIATTTAGVTSRADTGLNSSTQYCYEVRAFITANSVTTYSGFSNAACATTLPPPGLHVTAATSGIDLDADGYSVDVWQGSGASRIHVTGTSLPANGTVTINGLAASDYQVELSGVAVNCDPTSTNPQTVTLGTPTGAGVAIQFDINCAPVTQLAFVSTADGNPEIYVINSNGTGSTRLTAHPASDVDPAWSPDGAKIAFQSDRDGNVQIYVMNSDGSNPVPLTAAAGGNFRPAWSPDGTRIALASKRDGNGEIYLMNADGTGGLVNLTNHSADDGEPAWSPDGTKIAFQSNRGGYPAIYVMNQDGSGVTKLTNPEYSDGEPAWSPDGAMLAFSRAKSDPLGIIQVIFTVNADGSGTKQLTSVSGNSERHSHPAWYPDGRKITFVATTCGNTCSSAIQVVRTNGTDLLQLTNGSGPAWRSVRTSGISCSFDECPPTMLCGPDAICYVHCGDGYLDGDESDLDCGGSCGPCQSGQHCWSQPDCASFSCVNQVCQ